MLDKQCRTLNPRPVRCHAATIGKLFTHVPLFTKQYKVVPAKGVDDLKLGR